MTVLDEVWGEGMNHFFFANHPPLRILTCVYTGEWYEMMQMES